MNTFPNLANFFQSSIFSRSSSCSLHSPSSPSPTENCLHPHLMSTVPTYAHMSPRWETLICDRANLLMVDGKKQRWHCQIHTCTCTHIHTTVNRCRADAHKCIHIALCLLPAAFLLKLSLPSTLLCLLFLLCFVLQPITTTHLSFSQYIWHAQLLRSNIIIPPETHTCTYTQGDTLVFSDPRRSLLLFVTTEASLECVHVCRDAWCIWMLSRCFSL